MDTDQTFFDDDCRPVPVDEIDFAAMDARLSGKPFGVTDDDDDLEHKADILRVIQWLARDGASALEIGRRVLIIAHKCNPEATQRELARKLKMDEGQLSRKVKTVNSFLANGFKDN